MKYIIFWSIFSKTNPKPLFILGNPKSGTTIIANLLSKATKQTLTSDIQSVIKHATLQLDFNLLSFDDFIKQHFCTTQEFSSFLKTCHFFMSSSCLTSMKK